AIIQLQKGNNETRFYYSDISSTQRDTLAHQLSNIRYITDKPEFEKSFAINSSIIKITNSKPLIELYEQVMGVKVYQKGKGKPKQTSYEIENNVFISNQQLSDTYKPFVSQGIKRYH